MQGKVVWFNNTRGIGFIRPDEKGASDLFVHYSQIVGDGYKSLSEGQTVEYEVGYGPTNRIQANDVRVVG